jgi:hypothetical protein
MANIEAVQIIPVCGGRDTAPPSDTDTDTDTDIDTDIDIDTLVIYVLK